MNQSYFFQKKLLKNYLSINPDYNNLYKEKISLSFEIFQKETPRSQKLKSFTEISKSKFKITNIKSENKYKKYKIQSISTQTQIKFLKNKYKNLIEKPQNYQPFQKNLEPIYQNGIIQYKNNYLYKCSFYSRSSAEE
ncbi:MAG: hypothetical protein Q8800_00990 [Candidatus Phytoplasma australasiaticum]|nr:hypothetical protein [Candidatus Phytoplasma australasiaticum]MDV3177435.1 hypothetical protein [Candidatus Phytoplasma australasiaticum]